MRKFTLATFGIVLALAAAGCSKSPGDDAMTNDIKAKLFSDPDLKTTNIDVAVKNGAVTLSGEVPSPDIELKAVKLANDEPGVKHVDDQLKVQGAGAPAAPPPSGEMPRNSSSPSAPLASPNNPPGVGSAPQQAAAPPQPVSVTIPSGTAMTIRMIDGIDSATNRTGQQFHASLNDSIRLNGEVVVPRNSDVTVRLAQAQAAGRIKGQSELELQLVSMTVNGTSYPLTSNAYEAKGKARGKETAVRSGIGAAAGAVIGALAGGGKGAAIGAAVGGGGVAGYQMFTHGQQIKIPAETLLNFQLQAPVTVQAMPQ